MHQTSQNESSQKASYVIDPVTLREVVNNEALVIARISELEATGEPGDKERIAWLRMIGRLRDAEELGWLLLVRSGGANAMHDIFAPLPLEAVADALRLAHVLHWQRNYTQAELLFGAALEAGKRAAEDMDKDSRIARALVAFTHQHLGKMYFDQGQLATALRCFEHALALRHELQSPVDQLQSTRQAIATIESRMSPAKTSLP